MTGGASSLTFVGDLGGRPVVVKVAPPGLAPVGHRDVLRQARVIRALGATAVSVPEILVEDVGEPPDVPPLFVMSFAEGSSAEPLFDDDRVGSPRVIADRFRLAAGGEGAEVAQHRRESQQQAAERLDDLRLEPGEPVAPWRQALGQRDAHPPLQCRRIRAITASLAGNRRASGSSCAGEGHSSTGRSG